MECNCLIPRQSFLPILVRFGGGGGFLGLSSNCVSENDSLSSLAPPMASFKWNWSHPLHRLLVSYPHDKISLGWKHERGVSVL